MEINISLDMMFVNEVSSVMKISNHLKFITAKYITIIRKEVVLAMTNE